MTGPVVKLSIAPEESAHRGRLVVDTPMLYRERIDAVPGSRFSKGDLAHTVDLNYPTMLALNGVLKEMRAQISASPELIAWQKQEAPGWRKLAELSQQTLADLSEEMPGMYLHQVQDYKWLTFPGGPRGRLFINEMGIGKTRPVIRAMHDLQLFPALVVCPKTVVRLGWVRQLKELYPELRVGVATGSAVARKKVLVQAEAGLFDVVVMSWDVMRGHTRYESFGSNALKVCPECGGPVFTPADKEKAAAEGLPEPKSITVAQCQRHVKELQGIDWKLIIGDEAHRVLNVQGQTRMAWGGLIHWAKDKPKVWEMTGTPLRTRPDGLWSLLNAADPEAWPNKKKWVDRYCDQGENNDGFWEIRGYLPENKAELDKSLQAVTRRVLKAEALDLPDKLRGQDLIREVTMGMEQRKAYNSMRDDMILKVKEGTITASGALAVVSRLTMLASATGYPDPADETGKKMLLRLPSAKFDELVDMINFEELAGQFAIAFSSRTFLELCVNELIKKETLDPAEIGIISGAVGDKERERVGTEFQAGRLRVVAYTHKAGGLGIDLTKADDLVLMELDWDSVAMAQSLDRVHRVGMPDRAVRIWDIAAADTVNARQVERLNEVAELADAITHDKEKLLALLKGDG